MLLLISVGGVHATCDVNETSNLNAEDAVLTDTIENSDPDNLTVSNFENHENVLSSEEVYTVNNPIVNPSFEVNKTSGWDCVNVSTVNSNFDGKNGSYFVSLNSNGSYVSQIVNFNTIDSVSFWYMSPTVNSTIGVYLDDTCILDYTIKKTGYAKFRWEEVNIDTSGIIGYHKLKVLQNFGNGYVDNFNVNYNNNVLADFIIDSFSVDGDELTINFRDKSYGLITSYLWDFGDGNITIIQNPTHKFRLGQYTVTLTVSNAYSMDRHIYTLPIKAPTVESTGKEYSTIQSAVDNAENGDIITITPNIFIDSYSENLIVDKDLTLNFNGVKLISKDNALPVISIVNGAEVIVNNISLESNNIFYTDGSSRLIIENSNLNNANISLNNGNILFRNDNFNYGFFTIWDAMVTVDFCNFTSNTIVVNGGKTKISNSGVSFADVGVCQLGGELNLTSNSIYDNDIGVNVSSGVSNINFNEIYSNDKFGLVYSNDNIDYSNNWWGSNNPTFNSSLTVPDEYFDIYKASEDTLILPSYLILNISKHDLDYHYWIRGITYYNLTIDLCHNNLGEDVGKYGSLPSKFYDFKFNNVAFDVYIENGFKEYLFTWGYLTSDVDEMNIQLGNQTQKIILEIRPATLNIVNWTGYIVVNNVTYSSNNFEWAVNDTLKANITPSTTFKDSLEVVIECNDDLAVIFYTLDGSDAGYSPTRKVYTGPFTINETTVVHYCALDSLGNFYMIEDSTIQVNDASFIRDKCFIVFSWWFKELTDYYNVPAYYTLDGSNPVTSDTRVMYTHPFFIDDISTLRARIWAGTYGWAFRISTYYYDFSSTYLKEVNSSSSDAVWSKYQGDNNNSGVTNCSGPLNNISKWSLENIISSGSAVVDKEGHIYLAGDDGYLYCLNSQGLVIWRYGTTSKIICTPTIGNDGNIYFVNWLNATLYCLSPDGQLIWKYVLGDYNTGSSPVFGYDGILYAISGDDTYSTLFSFKNQKLLWTYKMPALIAHTPIIGDDGAIYLISKSNYLFGVNVDGSLKFGVTLTISDDEGGVVQSGDKGWYIEGSNHVSSNPASFVEGSGHYASLSRDDNYIYVVDHYAVLVYYFNGTQFAHKRISGASGTPSIYNGVLYISATSGLYAVNLTSGYNLWFKPLKTTSLSLSSPLISNGSVIYLSGNSTVYAVGLDGELLWSYSIPSKYGGAFSVSSPTLTDDGTLIVTTIQGIYAFNDVAAEFTYAHVGGTERTIQFTDLSTKGNNSYFWSFGDGYYSQEQNPQHMYAEPGKYRIELVVEHDGINLARNTTIEVISYDITPPAPVTAYINNTKTVGGTFPQTQTVSLTSSDDSGQFTIYYTVDGSNPLNSSTRRVYYEPFDIETYTVLNAVAVDMSNNSGKLTTLTFNITDAINVNDRINSTLIQKIQELLDNAEPNSKFVFDYDELYGANFTINKPLNIITNVNTKLIGNGNQPVFTINAKDTTINGFTIINDGADGIFINNTENAKIINSIITGDNAVNIQGGTNTLIKDSQIINSHNAIQIINSDKTTIDRLTIENSTKNGAYLKDSSNAVIQNSLFEGNGVDPYYSEANHILLDNSQNTRIVNNTLNHGYFGLYFKNTNKNTLIQDNTIYEGIGDAIYLSGRYIGLDIIHNTLEGCFNGINFNGYSEKVEVTNNLIQKMHAHEGEPQSGREYDLFYNFRHTSDLYGQYNNAIQVFELASNFHGEVHIENNVCILLEHRAWESRKTSTPIQSGCDGYGYNLMDGSDSYHWLTSGATHYQEGYVNVVLDRIGDSSYRLRLQNMRTGEYLSDIPAFDVTFTAGRYTQTVKFIDNQAVATFDVASSITTITAKISAEIKKSISWNTPISEGYSSSNKEKDSGYEAGEAINNPNPKAPSIADMIKRFSGNGNNANGNGNGHGHGNGIGNGNGNGVGNGGSYGTHNGASKGIEGTVNGTAHDLAKSSIGNAPLVGSPEAQTGSDTNAEGGSDGGDSPDSPAENPIAYEVTKKADLNNNIDLIRILVVILAIFFFIIGWRRRGDEDDEEI